MRLWSITQYLLVETPDCRSKSVFDFWSLGGHFNQRLDNMTVATGLQSLTFGKDFNWSFNHFFLLGGFAFPSLLHSWGDIIKSAYPHIHIYILMSLISLMSFLHFIHPCLSEGTLKSDSWESFFEGLYINIYTNMYIYMILCFVSTMTST